MPNIAQQDYIIIDWGGKDSSDATKKAEVDAILKKLYLANPFTMLSVLFKNYGTDLEEYGVIYFSFVSFTETITATVSLEYIDPEDGSPTPYVFSIAD